MKKTWDGGPAFPQERTLDCGSLEECEGLSIRDYFAAKVLAAICSKEPNFEERVSMENDPVAWMDSIAEIAYQYAESMIEERKKYYE